MRHQTARDLSEESSCLLVRSRLFRLSSLDHFSYAAKGIPIIFFFTGLHPDYHKVTDSVEKIHFEKMSRITRLVYELGLRLANLDHCPVRDFKGPRTGRGSCGRIAR